MDRALGMRLNDLCMHVHICQLTGLMWGRLPLQSGGARPHAAARHAATDQMLQLVLQCMFRDQGRHACMPVNREFENG